LRQSDAPAHLFNIPELDFSETLFAERLNHPWVRLGALSVSRANRRGPVEEEYIQNTLLLAPGAFAAAFDAFGAVGNVLWMVAKPGLVHSAGETKYEPFYQFHIAHPAVTAEPLVVPMPDADQPQLFINPDLWLFLELKEQNAGSGIWHDPRRLVDALVRRREKDLEVVNHPSFRPRGYRITGPSLHRCAFHCSEKLCSAGCEGILPSFRIGS
jgi:hypothetical protein